MQVLILLEEVLVVDMAVVVVEAEALEEVVEAEDLEVVEAEVLEVVALLEVVAIQVGLVEVLEAVMEVLVDMGEV